MRPMSQSSRQDLPLYCVGGDAMIPRLKINFVVADLKLRSLRILLVLNHADVCGRSSALSQCFASFGTMLLFPSEQQESFERRFDIVSHAVLQIRKTASTLRDPKDGLKL